MDSHLLGDLKHGLGSYYWSQALCGLVGPDGREGLGGRETRATVASVVAQVKNYQEHKKLPDYV